MASFAVVGGGFGGVAALLMLGRAGHRDVTVIGAVAEMERRGAATIEVRRAAAEVFDRELRQRLAGTVWHSGCTNWYLDSRGNDPNQWPWTWSTYRSRAARISSLAYEVA